MKVWLLDLNVKHITRLGSQYVKHVTHLGTRMSEHERVIRLPYIEEKWLQQ